MANDVRWVEAEVEALKHRVHQLERQGEEQFRRLAAVERSDAVEAGRRGVWRALVGAGLLLGSGVVGALVSHLL